MAGKQARDYLDELRDEIRMPLTAWEDELARIQKEEQEAALMELYHEEALDMNDLFDRETRMKEKENELAQLRREKDQRETARKDGSRGQG